MADQPQEQNTQQNPPQEQAQPQPQQAPPANNERPNTSKQFGLSVPESQLLVMIQQNTNAIMSAALSFISSDRLGYKVTPRTQFNLDQNFQRLTISEAPAEAQQGQQAQEPAKPAGSPVKTAQ